MTEEAVPVPPTLPELSAMVANNLFMRNRIGGGRHRGGKELKTGPP